MSRLCVLYFVNSGIHRIVKICKEKKINIMRYMTLITYYFLVNFPRQIP